MLLVRDEKEGRRRVAGIRGRLARGGSVHMLGIAGFGMAGVATLLQGRGFRVTGCDLVPNRISRWLEERGIPVAQGHDAAHLEPRPDWLVRSTAVDDRCVEVAAARASGIPVEHRGFVLPALLADRLSVAVTGTHGKTTTSSMVAQMLAHAGRAPGFCIGGEVTALGGVADPGAGEILVVEADESDGTLVLYEPDIAVITSIEYDHMEHFETEDALYRCFDVFGRSAKRLVYCLDDPRARAVCADIPGAIAYGFDLDAEVRGGEVECGAERVRMVAHLRGRGAVPVELPVGGRHNALNALAAMAVGVELDLDPLQMVDGLSRFRHARRRFEKVVDRDGVVVISDYAHHPTEIRALVSTAVRLPHERLIAVFQPHRFTRTRALGPDFPGAFEGVDETVLLPVYPASEAPLEGGTSDDLLGHFGAAGMKNVRLLASLDDAWNYLRPNLRRGDVLLVVGAGDVEQIAAWADRDL